MRKQEGIVRSHRRCYRFITAVFHLFLIELTNATTQSERSRPPHITLQEFASISFSEAPREFGSDEDGGVDTQLYQGHSEELWQDAIDYHWNVCLSHESEGTSGFRPLLDGKCSFLLCHSGGEGSGYSRKKKVQRSIAAASVTYTEKSSLGEGGNFSSSSGSDELDITLTTAYNRGDKWCGVTRLNATVAERVECGDYQCKVTPLFFGMKFMPGTVKKIERHVKEYYKIAPDDAESARFPVVRIELCPGVISQEDALNFTRIRSESEKGTNGIIQYVTNWLLERSRDEELNGPSTYKSNVAKSLFWTASSVGANEPDSRRALWRDLIQQTLETDYCDATYLQRLQWTLEFSNADTLSLMVTLNGTATVDIDSKCSLALVAGIAVLPAVCTIEIPEHPSVFTTNAQWMIQSGGVPEKRPWFDHGLNGSGQVVALADTGVDVDNCYFWDSGGTIPDLEPSNDHRKIVQYVPYINDDDVHYGHGTHVAGIIVGRRATDGRVESTGAADGVARGAKLAFFDIGDDDGNIWVGPSFLMLETGRTGNGSDPSHAHLHSASWGSRGDNYYTFQARNLDNYMHTFDDFLVIAATGNDGAGGAANTVWSPSTFKNGIAVGASHSCCEDLADGQLGPAYVASFSSRGPTQDGRMAPHVVAPGSFILSSGAVPSRVGECDEGVPTPGNARGGLLSLEGTSMAAPVVSGTAALVWQYFLEGWYPQGRKGSGEALSPSGALVKAVLLNGAQTNLLGVDNRKGNVEPVYPYDNTIGFGRIDLQKSLYVEGWSDVQVKIWDRETIDDGVSMEFNVTIDKSNGCTFDHFSVTLVWMDVEVDLGCKHCVINDLDLEVTKNGIKDDVYYPNGRSNRDGTNNAERIVTSDVQHDDNFTLTVIAFNLDGASQKFALVATGCFGGVSNNLDTSNNVFDNDDSAEQLRQEMRKQRIIIIVCSTVGTVILLVVCSLLYRRRRKGSSGNVVCGKCMVPSKDEENASAENMAKDKDTERIMNGGTKKDENNEHEGNTKSQA